MTKPWENYEAVIKELYSKHTLATVRQIMQEKYDFKASVRAYRQKLDAWDCTKYKKREGKSSSGAKDGSSGSKTSNPNLSSPKTTFQGQPSSVQHSGHGLATSTLLPEATAWPSTLVQGYGTATSWGPAEINSSFSPVSSMVPSNCNYPSASSDQFSDAGGTWFPYETRSFAAESSWDNAISNAPPYRTIYTTADANGVAEEDEEEGDEATNCSGRASWDQEER